MHIARPPRAPVMFAGQFLAIYPNSWGVTKARVK